VEQKTDMNMTYQDSIISFCTYFSVEPMGQSVINTIGEISLFVLFSRRIFKVFGLFLWFLVERRNPDSWKGQFTWVLGNAVDLLQWLWR